MVGRQISHPRRIKVEHRREGFAVVVKPIEFNRTVGHPVDGSRV